MTTVVVEECGKVVVSSVVHADAIPMTSTSDKNSDDRSDCFIVLHTFPSHAATKNTRSSKTSSMYFGGLHESLGFLTHRTNSPHESLIVFVFIVIGRWYRHVGHAINGLCRSAMSCLRAADERHESTCASASILLPVIVDACFYCE